MRLELDERHFCWEWGIWGMLKWGEVEEAFNLEG